MHKFNIGDTFTTLLKNKIVIIGLEEDGKYTISANNGNTILRNQTIKDIEEMEFSVD